MGTYADNFNAQAYNNSDGTVAWTTSWIEASDVTTGTVATNGAIQIIGGATDNLRFGGVTNDANGATLTRGIDLTGATSASVSYTANPDNLDAGENLTVWFAANGTTFVQIDTVTGDAAVTRNIPLTGALGPNSAIQFRVTGVNNTNEIISVDSVAVTITRPGLNTGVDTINGDAGDDTIIWNANPSGSTDGRDVVDGGTEGAAGDTFVVNGNASSETYNIYTRAAWQELGNSLAAFNAATEIIVARNGLTNADVIAELREIEEIRINSVDPSGTTGPAGNDAFNIVGDFAATSLRLNTITIDGNAGDDTIDITSLDSAHRIVFRSNGGNDTIIGTLRPEDVIELPGGATIDEYIETSANGVTTLTKGGNSISFVAPDGPPQIGDDEEDEDSLDDWDAIPLDDDDAAVGGGLADILRGDLLANFLSGQGGRDIILGVGGDDDIFGGADDDMLYGDSGNDRLFGDAGNDLIVAGDGDDTAFGGAGDDLFIASIGDGDDMFYGDELSACIIGNDTLDMAAITANITVNLGTGFQGRGSASSSQSGTDTLWGIENVVTGSGNDTITASKAVNVMDGGTGNDTFKFLSTADANGDTILGFQPGDKIDVSAIDADSASSNHTFKLVTGSGFNAAGALKVTHETHNGQDYTLLEGNTNGGSDAEFKVSIKGHHNLTNDDFNL